jgi:hypothetical protein
MNIRWRIIIISGLVLIVGLIVAMVLRQPAQRTTFAMPEESSLQQLVADDLLAVSGVHGIWVESERLLVVDHCPELEPAQLRQIMSEKGIQVLPVNSRPIRLFQVAGNPAPGQTCRQGAPCSTSSSWRELLDRWQTGK